MDAVTRQARKFFAIAYAPEKTRTQYRRGEPFHLSWLFDAAVVATLLIAVMGYITT